jgi:hypothetical protein
MPRGAAEAAKLLEVHWREAALLAAHAAGRSLGVERGLEKKVREGESARVRDALLLGALLAQVDLVHLVVQYLGKVHRRRL